MRTAAHTMAEVTTAPATAVGEAATAGMAAIQGGRELGGDGVTHFQGDLVFGLDGRIGGGGIPTRMRTTRGGTRLIRMTIHTPACRVIRALMTTTETILHQETRKPDRTRTALRGLQARAMRIT